VANYALHLTNYILILVEANDHTYTAYAMQSLADTDLLELIVDKLSSPISMLDDV
jgi:hypothetical protein